MRHLTVLFVFAIFMASAAHADGPEKKKAEAHYLQGETFFRKGLYEEAIVEYEAAYALVAKPLLLYNIARAYHELGDKPQALDYYKRYLEEEPKGKASSDARDYVAALTVEIKAEDAARKAEVDAARAEAEKQAEARRLADQQAEAKRLADEQAEANRFGCPAGDTQCQAEAERFEAAKSDEMAAYTKGAPTLLGTEYATRMASRGPKGHTWFGVTFGVALLSVDASGNAATGPRSYTTRYGIAGAALVKFWFSNRLALRMELGGGSLKAHSSTFEEISISALMSSFLFEYAVTSGFVQPMLVLGPSLHGMFGEAEIDGTNLDIGSLVPGVTGGLALRIAPYFMKMHPELGVRYWRGFSNLNDQLNASRVSCWLFHFALSFGNADM